ncbi:MAG: hypothetical protein HC933_06650 [Pleurocapsa sp. SU_196_0]|nr:hypothetical protein [Pleurocapsa sp. SU_196_0]
MTLRNKQRPSASNNYGRGNQKRKQPEPSPVSSRLLTGLAILAILIASVVVLFKPYPLYPRTESLESSRARKSAPMRCKRHWSPRAHCLTRRRSRSIPTGRVSRW